MNTPQKIAFGVMVGAIGILSLTPIVYKTVGISQEGYDKVAQYASTTHMTLRDAASKLVLRENPPFTGWLMPSTYESMMCENKLPLLQAELDNALGWIDGVNNPK